MIPPSVIALSVIVPKKKFAKTAKMNKAKFSNRKTLNNAPTESVMVDIRA